MTNSPVPAPAPTLEELKERGDKAVRKCLKLRRQSRRIRKFLDGGKGKKTGR
jgi:hypothetical protein